MPGIIGIVDFKRQLNLNEILPNMLRCINHDGMYETGQFIDGNNGFGWAKLRNVSKLQGQISNEDRSVQVFMDGEIYDTQKTKRELIHYGHLIKSEDGNELIPHLYEQFGTDFVNHISGNFMIAIYDKNANKLVLANDRFGIKPYYYLEHQGRIIFSPEMKSLMLDPGFEKTINSTAISDYLTFGYSLGDKTFFNKVKLFPPATIAVYEDNSLNTKQYWMFPERADITQASEKHYMEQYAELFKRAVEIRCTSGTRIGLGLSGGHDSRTVFGFIPPEYYPVSTFTIGTPGCRDIHYSIDIAYARNSPHYVIVPSHHNFINYLDDMIWQIECMPGLDFYHILLMSKFKSNYIDVEMSGISGNLIMGDYALPWLFNDKKNISLTTKLYQCNIWGIPQADQRLFFNTGFYSDIKNSSQDDFVQIFKGTHVDAYSQYMHFLINNKIRRIEIFPGNINSRFIQIAYPILDYELTDLCFKLPFNLLKNQYLYKKLIRLYLADLAKIPSARTGCKIDERLPFFISRILFRKGLNRLQNAVLHNSSCFSEIGTYDFYTRWFKHALHEYTESILLDRKTIDRGYYQESYIRKIVDEHYSDKRNHMWFIMRLISLEKWHRFFID